jgi:hypothetical protein
VLDPSEARAQYRALPLQRRWRMRRATGFARPMANRKDAGIMLWWARRQLSRFPWTVPLGVYAIAVIWGLPRSGISGQGRVFLALFAGGLWGYLFGVLSTRRLRTSITANAKVAHAPADEAHAGLPSDTLIWVLTGAAVVAAVATVLLVF